MCVKGKIVLEFSWCGSESLVSLPSIFLEIAHIWPSITPSKHCIRNPLDTLKREELKSNKTIVHCCYSLLILESASLCPFGALCVLPKLEFSCELAIKRWMIEVMEAQVDYSVSSVRRSADRGCHYCIFDFINRNIFSCPIYMHLNMNNESMDVFNFLYIIEYIC